MVLRTTRDFKRTIRMQVLRDVTIIASQYSNSLLLSNSTMAVSNLELDSAIMQASQQVGYATIRPDQITAIKSFMEGRDVFISLPTGSGKSLRFFVLPYAFDYLYKRVGSIVVVVSPLIALM